MTLLTNLRLWMGRRRFIHPFVRVLDLACSPAAMTVSIWKDFLTSEVKILLVFFMCYEFLWKQTLELLYPNLLDFPSIHSSTHELIRVSCRAVADSLHFSWFTANRCMMPQLCCIAIHLSLLSSLPSCLWLASHPLSLRCHITCLEMLACVSSVFCYNYMFVLFALGK